VLRWNRPADGGRQAEVAAALGAPGAAPDALLETLIAGLGMPGRLSAVGISPRHFPGIAEQAMGTPWVPCNPRPIRGPQDVQEILAMAA
jgi:alcohol dehydrogenase class IV